MKQHFLSLAVASLVVAGSAFAQSTESTRTTTTTTDTQYNGSASGNTGSAAPMGTGTSYGTNTYSPSRNLRDESMGISPQIGVVTFTDGTGNTDSRALVGLGLDFNLAAASTTPKDTFFGIQTGAFYSHLGNPGSSFWGAEQSGAGGSGANLILLPANLKLGYNLTDSFRASVRGGGNVIYRSASTALNLGDNSNGSDSSWKIYPDVGMDLEWQVGDNVAIIARPDLTIAPGNNMFTGTLGATIMPSF